ncbi:MAG: hypothetical protein WAL25_11425, partial [Acidimicrobiia bacterium]
ELLGRVEAFESLSRWEKSEVGRGLRRLGHSYGEIMNLIEVKKSTLATWCRDIDLTEEQIRAIKRRHAQHPGIPRDTQRKRRREVQVLRAGARNDVSRLLAQPLWVAGVALYWGEGSKTTRRLAMANADPAALRLFKSWATAYHDPDSGWRARLNLHADNNEQAARGWWSQELSISIDDFTKSYIKPDGTGHRKNHLPYGVCTLIKRKSANAFVVTMTWIDFFQSNLGS